MFILSGFTAYPEESLRMRSRRDSSFHNAELRMTAGLKGQKHKCPISVCGIGRTFLRDYSTVWNKAKCQNRLCISLAAVDFDLVINSQEND
jgi:hypothetical protein